MTITHRPSYCLYRRSVATFVLAIAAAAGVHADRLYTLHNPLAWARPAADVVIPRDQLNLSNGQTVTAVEMSKLGTAYEYPFQLDDLDGDGQWDELYFQVAIEGDQTLKATVRTGRPAQESQGRVAGFASRVDALADAAPQSDVSKPAWESDTMAYCAYGAAQVDAIGKIMPNLSFDFLYREPYHSQHEFTVEHGMDFLSVGNTMGAHAPFVREPDGTIARPWTTDAYSVRGPLDRDARHTSIVRANGPLRAIVETRIDRWTTDRGEYACTIRYAIAAGQRHTRVHVNYDKMPVGDAASTLGAGTRAFREDLHVQMADDRVVVASANVRERSLRVPWLGRAIVAADDTALEPIVLPDGSAPADISGDGPNYGVLFAEAGREVEYAFVACWSFDDGISSWAQFQAAIDQLQRELSEPISATPEHAGQASSAR